MYLCVCVCVCLHALILCIYTCHFYTSEFLFVHIHLCIYTYHGYTSKFLFVHVHLCMNVHVYVFVCMCRYDACVCMWEYLHVKFFPDTVD